MIFYRLLFAAFVALAILSIFYVISVVVTVL